MSNFWQKLEKPFFVMAPMADVTDAPFRSIIAKYGRPDVMYTEFVSADGLFLGGYDNLICDLEYSEEERPIVAQFFSKKPELMVRAAELARERGFDGVDINMGCPDKNVCKQGAGAAMIQTPELACEIIAKTKKAAGNLPVSVKTRIGFNEIETDTWVRNILEEEPAVLILHARTKKEKSKVPAHWDEIKKAVEIRDEMGVSTLIVGNGDVKDMEDARARASATGADGIMLGRAVFGNPWLFSGRKKPELKERLEVLLEHTKLYEEILGGKKPFSVMKNISKHICVVMMERQALFAQLMESENAEQVEKHIKEFLANH